MSVASGLPALALLVLRLASTTAPPRAAFAVLAMVWVRGSQFQLNPPPPADEFRLTEPLVWHDLIPQDLQPRVGQPLVAESAEFWQGWWYWHLDYYTETGFKVRYVADIDFCWNPGWGEPTPPWLHLQGRVNVKQVKSRGGWRSTLMIVENERQNLLETVLWKLKIYGCYLTERPYGEAL